MLPSGWSTNYGSNSVFQSTIVKAKFWLFNLALLRKQCLDCITMWRQFAPLPPSLPPLTVTQPFFELQECKWSYPIVKLDINGPANLHNTIQVCSSLGRAAIYFFFSKFVWQKLITSATRWILDGPMRREAQPEAALHRFMKLSSAAWWSCAVQLWSCTAWLWGRTAWLHEAPQRKVSPRWTNEEADRAF